MIEEEDTKKRREKKIKMKNCNEKRIFRLNGISGEVKRTFT
jgi:hypothetical protein